LSVENEYSAAPPKQVLKLSWKQNEDTLTDSNEVYYIYRWTNHSDYLKDTLLPQLNPHRAGVVAHMPGEERGYFVDDGPGAPTMPQDAGKTYWYTVRVKERSACDGNLSPHSGPAFGVLRDRVGPDGPNGGLSINCCRPDVDMGKNIEVGLAGADPNRAYYRPYCDRLNPGIEWAEFYVFAPGTSNLISRLDYFGNQSRVAADFSLSRATALSTQMVFYCRVGTYGGKVSVFRVSTTGVPPAGYVRQVVFTADLDCEQVLLTGKRDPCDAHEPNPPGNTGTNDCIELLLNLAAGTKEVKIYRRIDFGPLMMINQISTNGPVLTVKDCTIAASPGEVCYFAQAFDEHGNGSPMVPVGTCIKFSGTTPLPAPVLSPLSAEGNGANPLMNISWASAPYGVERFEVSIAIEGSSMTPADFKPILSTLVRVDSDVDFKSKGVDKNDDFSVYHTPTVGVFYDGQSSALIPIQLFKRYYVYIRAIGKDGQTSARSNVEEFIWSEPDYEAPMVPWPDRPLPDVIEPFHPRLVATNLQNQLYPVGIRIGEHLPIAGFTSPTNGRPMLKGFVNPTNYLFATNGQAVLPLALYRMQVPDSDFPTVSKDLVQVSPLMEKIAYQQTSVAPHGPVTIIHDPFVMALPTGVPGAVGARYDLYLLDTQPLIQGARYRYYLVRFGENREIEAVIPTNEVEL
jgi:hypothetical protein